MRILILSTYFRPDVASTGVIMSTLADEFVSKGHRVTVVTSTPHYDADRAWREYSGKLVHLEQSGGMDIYRIASNPSENKSSIVHRLIGYARFHGFSFLKAATLPKHDVILVPSPPLSNGVIAQLLGFIRGTPFVYNVQDIWPDVAIRAGVLKNPLLIRALKQMESFIYRRAGGLAVISDGFRQNLAAKGVPQEKISVIPNFIDTEFIRPQSKANPFTERHKLRDKFVVLFAGNMGFSQGIEVIIDTARELQGIPEIHFLLVGNGAARVRAQEQLASLGLKNAEFLPFQPHEDLPNMYGSADLCLIPLRRGFTNDSVPCKLFTIMAAGKPSIAAVDRGSETWRLLEGARAGLCIEPENPQEMARAILHYYRNQVEASAAGRRARRFVETEFLHSALADRYLEALHRAVACYAKTKGVQGRHPASSEDRTAIESSSGDR